MRKLALSLAIVLAIVVGSAMPASAAWTWQHDYTGGMTGSDLLSDGTTLYRLGGDAGAANIWTYDGPGTGTWTLLDNSNPRSFTHKSPGENWRSYCSNGFIVTDPADYLLAGVKYAYTYDISGDTWTTFSVPLLNGGNTVNGAHRSIMNPQTGQVYIGWSEDDVVDYNFVYAPLDLSGATPSWGTASERGGDLVVGGNHLCTASGGSYVFTLTGEGRYVSVNVYNLSTQAADFSGSWTASSSFDLGEGVSLSVDFGTDNMAWDPGTGKLYVVGTYSGITLQYDPVGDSWTQLPTCPDASYYREHAVEVCDGWLYRANGGFGMYAMEIPEPASAVLLLSGGLLMMFRRRKR